MKKLILLLILCRVFAHSQEPTFKVTKLIDNGTSENRVNFVIMGDGYIQSEIPMFIQNATDVANFMVNMPPYSDYKSYINIYAIEVISNESGTDEKDQGILKDTYLNSGFNHDIHRLLTTDYGKCAATAARHVPAYDQAIVLVNTPRYGGSGGSVSVSYNGGASPKMNVHEVGHSFAGLADEYTYGHSDIINYEPSQPNVTIETNREEVKWSRWIDQTTPVPTPLGQGHDQKMGLFEGGYYRPKGVYRPANNCMMRMLDYGFCKVCGENHIHKFQQIVDIIDEHTPQFGQLPVTDLFNFFVKPVAPSTHNMNTKWFLDNVERNSSSIYAIQPGELSLGKHKVKVVVSDPQPDVRYPVAESSREVEWEFSVIDTENMLRPVAVADTYSTPKGQSLRIEGIGITANDYDLNGDMFNASLVSATTHGTIILQPEGSFTYMPNQGFDGADSFTYKINDGTSDSLPAVVTINVISTSEHAENFSSAPVGPIVRYESSIGTFSAPPPFLEIKSTGENKYMKILSSEISLPVSLILSEQLSTKKIKRLSFNFEQLRPDSAERTSSITISARTGEEWEKIHTVQNLHGQTDFSIDLSRQYDEFLFLIDSSEPINIYSVTVETVDSDTPNPPTTRAFTVNFDLDGKGVRTGGGRLTQRVILEGAATAPRVQAKPGFKFTGWSEGFGGIESNLTVRATYSEVTNSAQLQLNLVKGWNFISIPLKNADLRPLLKTINGKCWKWSENNTYEPVNSAESQQGLWVNVKNDKSVIVKGEPTSSETISLKFGWNAYGPYKDGTIPEGIDAIFAWGNNKYKQLNSEEDKLERGKAYWIFSTNQEDIELRIEP